MLFSNILPGKPKSSSPAQAAAPGAALNLADVTGGQEVYIQGFTASMPGERRAHLQAYGLTPGQRVCVLQRRPVVVVRVEHTELALEPDLARQIQVERR
ncbi:MAG: ferrous iron transport protein A [Chloroflexota bacterium]